MALLMSSVDLAEHNTLDSVFVALNGRILDLTQIIHEALRNGQGVLVKPMIHAAGTDISHWFDKKTGQPKTHIHPELGIRMPYCPHGRYLHIPPPEPLCDWDSTLGGREKPWWNDETLVVGKLSIKRRRIRVVNVLSSQEHVIDVCAEDTLAQIQERYLQYNAHASSYTWKHLSRTLDLNKTLSENGLQDDSDELARLGIPEDEHLLTLHLVFNDDLTTG